ncbi:hypothetical protein [Pseudochelatococcus sp. G4_1912]|uniref:hypothetical protein n=1 Tax=Pseudochelatococcus sp. G4_1912 TaxID=3114288 RepID=UPI0039C70599
MPVAAILDGSIVSNIIIVDSPEDAVSVNAIICPDNVSIGWAYTNGAFAPPALSPNDLAKLKITLKAQVDAAAEIERYRYITPGAGQAMTYQAKAAEAITVLGLDPAVIPDADDYPLLAAEIGITGATIREVAGVVLDLHRQWLQVGAAIERVRLTAKAQIDAAEDEATARTIEPTWPSAT